MSIYEGLNFLKKSFTLTLSLQNLLKTEKTKSRNKVNICFKEIHKYFNVWWYVLTFGKLSVK